MENKKRRVRKGCFVCFGKRVEECGKCDSDGRVLVDERVFNMSDPKKGKHVFRVKAGDLAEVFGVSKRTIFRRISDGRLVDFNSFLKEYDEGVLSEDPRWKLLKSLKDLR